LARLAIKQKSNQPGQSYRSNFNSRQGEAGGIKRNPSANSILNPFRKAQRLYHIQSTPSSNPTPNKHYERHPNNEVEELEVSPQGIEHCSSLEEVGCISDVEQNFMTEASLAYHK